MAAKVYAQESHRRVSQSEDSQKHRLVNKVEAGDKVGAAANGSGSAASKGQESNHIRGNKMAANHGETTKAQAIPMEGAART